jgi:hypothetical protein
MRFSLCGVALLFSITTVHGQVTAPTEVIDSIEPSIVRANRDGKGTTWFHPRGGVMPTAQGPVAFLTLQDITGSDYFGQAHWSISHDQAKTWSDPTPIPGLGRIPLKPGTDIGICDVVPEYHAKTNTVLALGYSAYYRKGAKDASQRPLYPFYFVRSADGNWTAPQRLVWDDPRCADLLSAGCAQRLTLADGDVLIPVSFGSKEKPIRSATTLLCSFDGKTLTVKKAGTELPGKRGRGFIEPSITVLDGIYYMTIRSEDGKGYLSTSTDGLAWQNTIPWAWGNGEALTMSTTQQHWLTHSDTLYLVYTRKSELNPTVFRWRAPLYLAAVDRKTLRLVRETERIVFPIKGDGVKDGANVAYSGNFHTMPLTKNESLITDCECLPNNGFKGDQIQARIRWKVPNRLVD